MHISVYKTSIRKDDLECVGAALAHFTCIKRWTVDCEDVDCVLRIESIEDNQQAIIHILTRAGYLCEELRD